MKNLLFMMSFVFLMSCGADNLNKTLKSKTTSVLSNQVSIIQNETNDILSDSTDSVSPDCTEEVLKGWKCVTTNVITDENLSYKIAVRWSRPNLTSIGTMLMAVGGAGKGESRDDPPSKIMMDELNNLDQMRVIEIDFLDPVTPTNPWGGYWNHSGGYKSAGLAFKAAFDFILSRKIIRGSFLNYLGGSNASTVAAYAMANLGLDKYFDRVVFQMGPFLPDLSNACNKNSASSFFQNNPDQQKSVANLLNFWANGDVNKNVCDNLVNERVSILKYGKKNFPNTHVHVIVGAKEVTEGFGAWILASNLEWYNGISAKTKIRIIRPEMGHNNSYVDMRRFLKLAPNEVAANDSICKDSTGSFCDSNSKSVEWLCKSCGQSDSPGIGWNDVGGGCFHKQTQNICSQCSQGTFCNGKEIIDWKCNCDASLVTGWVDVGNKCFHRRSGTQCQ